MVNLMASDGKMRPGEAKRISASPSRRSSMSILVGSTRRWSLFKLTCLIGLVWLVSMAAQRLTLIGSALEASYAALEGSPPEAGGVTQGGVLPPVESRQKVRINLQDWANRLSEEIRAVGNRTSCVYSIRRAYEEGGRAESLDPVALRNEVLQQINLLLSQHRAAVSAIVADAETLAQHHKFLKNLTVNYTDVHRLRNELDPPLPMQTVIDPVSGLPVQQQVQPDSSGPAGSLGSSSGASGGPPQFTSIGGGTPVPGPAEWQTPMKSLVMVVNKNFGDIPVNTSMSAVHLPLPIYAGQPEIMNGIAWTEKLDQVFKRNLGQFAHVHHQYYGDRLGFLRTFPAHKWRIPRLEPDLFDARTRPWYVAGGSSPKNLVILIDSSGSMTGLRREIAKGVVFEILDTLTSSDYFSVMRFSESITPIGLPKCSDLRQPKLTPAMRQQCRSAASLQESSERLECSHFFRQLERARLYAQERPEMVQAQNGSYMTDEAYEKSIGNVTNEIRDAYMLPATSRNIRYLKSNFSMPTAGIANFTNALMGAFELLQAYERSADMGAQCNQAIMLITDGAIRSHEEVFNRFNYPNATVRMFTYVIGREVGDIRPTKAIACNNRGYYTRVINLSEVREQVLKYLSVMARPLVLAKQHLISWTPAYGDETHQVLTDWVLEIKRRERARIMLNEERERQIEANVVIEQTNITEYDDLPLVDEVLKNRIICEDNLDDAREMDQSLADELDPLGYNELACHWSSRRADLLTSVVKPVYYNNNTSLVFERVLHKNIWSEQETHVRNAQMLGVAAVDLRIADILKSVPSYLLGPNAYPILMGQNGFVMHHPDLRALLEDPFDRQSKILKPYFNAVDLTHIEQVYLKNESLESASNINRIRSNLSPKNDMWKLLKLREAALRAQQGSDQFYVKRALDCRRRPHIRQQHFYYGPIKDTPFSLILALPVSYGLNRVNATRSLQRAETSRFLSPSAYDLWTVHPEYKYCEGSGLVHRNNDSVWKILEVLKLVDSGAGGSVHFEDLNAISASNANSPNAAGNKQRVSCDRNLFPSLIFDAAATSNAPNSFCKSDQDNCYKSNFLYSSRGSNDDELCTNNPEEMRSKLANIYGLEMSFVATRSGLTRVRVYDLSHRIKKLADLFIQRHNKALDESWYSRTVEWNLRFSEEASVISVPYNAYIRLVAKLRQRITQRTPAANETRANCDISDEELPGGPFESEPSAESKQPASESPGASTEAGSPVSSMLTAERLSGSEESEPAAQNDEPPPSGDSLPTSSEQPPATAGESPERTLPKVDYSKYSTFDFLDLLTNSSVHVSVTQSVIAFGGSKQRAPVAVSGLLYDYATFARRFLNTTSLNIEYLDEPEASNQQQQALKVNICPKGECPNKCGFRNDTIDCLLVDNNGFIIVAEDLPYIGRSLAVYDERLMQSLVERHVFHRITLIDYQAICTRSAEQVAADQKAAAAASTASPLMQITSNTRRNYQTGLALLSSILANAASSFLYTLSVLYALLTAKPLLEDFRGPEEDWPAQLRGYLVAGQSAVANQSLLAMLPNKTYLRPCEKTIHLYETRPASEKLTANAQQDSPAGQLHNQRRKLSIQEPEYYESKCNCSAWYVYEQVPKTNLILLIVNTTTECRRCDQASQPAQVVLDGSVPSSASNYVPVVPPPVDLNGLPLAGIITPQSSVATNLSNSPGSNKTAEEQVCAMLERDSSLYVTRTSPDACYSFHEKEAEIPLCGRASSSALLSLTLLLFSLATSQIAIPSAHFRALPSHPSRAIKWN